MPLRRFLLQPGNITGEASHWPAAVSCNDLQFFFIHHWQQILVNVQQMQRRIQLGSFRMLCTSSALQQKTTSCVSMTQITLQWTSTRCSSRSRQASMKICRQLSTRLTKRCKPLLRRATQTSGVCPTLLKRQRLQERQRQRQRLSSTGATSWCPCRGSSAAA